MTIRKPRLTQTATALLILVMLFTWVGHLFTQSVAVHAIDQARAPYGEHGQSHRQHHNQNPNQTHSQNHSHEQQSFHQTSGIGHQHPPLSPDHLHETLQLPLIALSDLPGPVNLQPDTPRGEPPAAPLYRIERPPRHLG